MSSTNEAFARVKIDAQFRDQGPSKSIAPVASGI